MKPVYIYFNELIFIDKKRFILKFSKNDEIKVVFFWLKKVFYYSMKCFFNLGNDIKNYKKCKKFKNYQKYAKYQVLM